MSFMQNKIIYPWFKPSNKNKEILKNISKLVSTNKMTMGNEVYKLEKRLEKKLNVKHVVLSTSGTSSLMMATSALNVNYKTKVITTNLTWIATINPALSTGANIKVVDTYTNNQCVNFEKLIKEIKIFKPDILYLVHLNGDVYYNLELDKLKKKMGFLIIEDAAQSFLVKQKNLYCGTKYEIGCFSLSITKLINMIYGGFCTTNSTKLYNKLIAIRNNGVNAEPENSKMEIAKLNGFNFKPSNLHATIGLAYLKDSQQSINKISNIYNLYKKKLSNHNKISMIENYTKKALPLYILVYVKNKKEFVNFCNQSGIGLHFALRTINETKLISSKGEYPNSNFFSKNLIRLPCGPGYSLNEINKIINILNKY